ncbi:MAG: radical SAM protein [Acidobacteriia bacterium]|nr:radical SAM protein [Terriglobia bacterium]
MGILTVEPKAKSRRKSEFQVIQPETTFTGAPIKPLAKGLPKWTESLCPECRKVIDARLFEENGAVYMQKTCAEHGDFRDLIYSDAKLYLKMEEFEFGDNRGLENPQLPDAVTCPDDCGMCSLHTSHTVLSNVDLTNRCNLTCPVCFANANVQGYLYEPSFEQLRAMLQTLRDQRPVPNRVVQFSGGEPTIYPRFHDVLRMATEMGFTHIQCATNGILFADLEFAEKSHEAGLHTLYLQFDGVTDDVYLRTRGVRLLEKKLAAIENCRKAGLKIIFVPTIVKGVNDHEIGAMIRLAIDNVDCVSGFSFQPVCFTGRINRRELEAKRFTQSDLAHCVADQTGLTDKYDDWFPLSCTSPFSKLLTGLQNYNRPNLTSHPHCAMGTYLYVDPRSKKAVPITKFFDMPAMLRDIDLLAREARGARFKLFTKINAWQKLRRHFRPQFAPPGLTFERFLQTLQGMTDHSQGRGAGDGTFTYKTLLVAGMHFMDAYNYDIERVKRCVIHYPAPDGRVYPFCTYNSGPCFREKIEKEFSVPFDLKAAKSAPANGNGNGLAQAESL